MKHVIIGTAGHVDHGKTLLVKALTGIDTDRLQEEKTRGITIDLGFAHLDFEDGTQAGIIDVPGHEKFIKNMLAGAGGIDLAMLIVAADEGFMPQTVEHLGILSLLGIRDGLVVITKTDLAETAWLDMIREEVAERVKGSFLEGKPVLAVSAYTGEGIGELRDHLHRLVLQAAEKNMRIPFRLPIDRVFSVDGFGTVVTGTLIEGCVNVGETAETVPSGQLAKVRSLQVHDRDVSTACAGQRVAMNLAGLKKSDLRRGDCVARPGSLRTSMLLDVRLQNLKTSGRVVRNHSQLHLHHGASVLLTKVVLLDRDSLDPGESCYAQLRLTEPLAAKPGDRFVVRFLSPLETIGGGVILDEAPARHKRCDSAVLQALAIRENGSEDEKIVQTIATYGHSLPDRAGLMARLVMEGEEFDRVIGGLLRAGKILEPLPQRYLAASVMDAVFESCRRILETYHKANPLHAGMRAAELRQKLFPKTEQTVSDALLRALEQEGRIRFVADRYAMADFEIVLTKRQHGIRDALLQAYRAAGLEPENADDITARLLSPQERTEGRQVLDSLLSDGELMMLTPQIIYHRETYAAVCAAARDYFSGHETLLLADFRDQLGTSRKYAVAILEYFDRSKITKKEGDSRRLLREP
jgi:selenocysteine-specific elongation factor